MASKPEPSSDWMRPNLDLQPKQELPKADRERDRLYLMSRYWRCQKSMLMFPQLIVYQKKFADPLF